MATVVTRLYDSDPSTRSVELDGFEGCGYEKVAGLLHGNSNVTSFHINDGVFDREGFRSPTWRKLKALILCVRSMVSLEDFCLNGRMFLDNTHDVQIIADAIARHPVLRTVTLNGFTIYANDYADSDPLLEPLLAALSSIDKLEAFHLQCSASYKKWSRSYLSSQVLIPICQSKQLQKLTLAGVGLRDEHFLTLSREIQRNQETSLQELVLNGNENTDRGLESMIHLLVQNRTIEKLEMHNSNRVADSVCEQALSCLDQNHVIKYLLLNTPYSFSSELDFYLLLNRAGRKTLLDPDVVPEKAIDVLAAANGNVGVLMHLLRENPSLCREHSASSIQENQQEKTPAPQEGRDQDTKKKSQLCAREKRIDPRAHLGIPPGFSDESGLVWRRFWYRTPPNKDDR